MMMMMIPRIGDKLHSKYSLSYIQTERENKNKSV